MMKNIILILIVVMSNYVFSEAKWYRGEISRIWPMETVGGFVIMFKDKGQGTSLDDCKHKYAYFKAAEIQPEMLKNSMTVALSAFHANSEVGLVIDKSLNGEYCHALSIDVRK